MSEVDPGLALDADLTAIQSHSNATKPATLVAGFVRRPKPPSVSNPLGLSTILPSDQHLLVQSSKGSAGPLYQLMRQR